MLLSKRAKESCLFFIDDCRSLHEDPLSPAEQINIGRRPIDLL